MQACQKCRVKSGYTRKDKGAHTAELKQCDKCGDVKPILDRRHWVKHGKK